MVQLLSLGANHDMFKKTLVHADAPLALKVFNGQAWQNEAPVELENVPASQGVQFAAPGRAL